MSLSKIPPLAFALILEVSQHDSGALALSGDSTEGDLCIELLQGTGGDTVGG